MTMYMPMTYRCKHCGGLFEIEQLASFSDFMMSAPWSDGWREDGPESALLVSCKACDWVVWLPHCEHVREYGGRPVRHDGLEAAREWTVFEAADVKLGATRAVDPTVYLQREPPAPTASPQALAVRIDESDARASRAYLARRVLHQLNHRFREGHFHRAALEPMTEEEQGRRLRVLTVLKNAALANTGGGESQRLELAEWQRETADYSACLKTLESDFANEDAADLAAQMRVLAWCCVRYPVRLDLSPPLQARRREAHLKATRARTQAREAEKARLALEQAPLKFVEAMSQGLNPMETKLPHTMAVIMRANVRGYHWDTSKLPAAIGLALLRICGQPPAPLDLRALHSSPVDDDVVDFLAAAMRGTTWANWEYSPVGLTPPRRPPPAA